MTIVTDTNAMQAPPPPLFYSRIEVLAKPTHKDFKVRPDNEYTFARKANAIPLTVPEFALAARHYPIIMLGEECVPTAAIGFLPENNLFVNAQGQWDAGVYIPAYVRRHPFILLGNETDEKLTLGIDIEASSNSPGARPLFDEAGKETDAVNQALNFCDEFHKAFIYTRQYSAAMKAAGIIEDSAIEAELTPGKKSSVGNFKRINEEKFQALPDATILEWRKNGFLHSAYFQIQSMNNWDFLLNKTTQLNAAA
jgi:hypothetical protein